MICIQICASNEWEAFRKIMGFTDEQYLQYPYGEYVGQKINGLDCIFYHSKATKTRAAGACQYAIDHWNPERIFVMGTAGGIGPGLKDLDFVIASKTVQCDCIEAMGAKPQYFYEILTCEADNSWIDFSKIHVKLIPGVIATADQDVGFRKAKELRKHGVMAADWESGAIAHICKLNKIPVTIIRGITDIPLPENQNDNGDFIRNTPIIMKTLLKDILPALLSME